MEGLLSRMKVRAVRRAMAQEASIVKGVIRPRSKGATGITVTGATPIKGWSFPSSITTLCQRGGWVAIPAIVFMHHQRVRSPLLVMRAVLSAIRKKEGPGSLNMAM
jgi:hypothetical protein